MRRLSPERIRHFRQMIWNFYRKNGRHELPWRNLLAGKQGHRDPYRILISEIMLQQTQVERVRGYYDAWLTKFPTVRSLAQASLGDVLKQWQGLGYNRRAKMLHEAAKEIVEKYRGVFPHDVATLQTLRGVGPYTARAVAAFALNQDVVFIETNIRTVILHHFFSTRSISTPPADMIYHISGGCGDESEEKRTRKIRDEDMLQILTQVLPKGRSRAWYAALMDYGSYLKRSGVRINAKANGYTKQSAFKGSAREARGAILKALVKAPSSKKYLEGILGPDRRGQVALQLTKLLKEGMVETRGNIVRLPI